MTHAAIAASYSGTALLGAIRDLRRASYLCPWGRERLPALIAESRKRQTQPLSQSKP